MMNEYMKGFYYCRNCNRVFELQYLFNEPCPDIKIEDVRCSRLDHVDKAPITSKQYIKWLKKKKPILDLVDVKGKDRKRVEFKKETVNDKIMS